MQNELQINPTPCHIAKHVLGEELYGTHLQTHSGLQGYYRCSLQ